CRASHIRKSHSTSGNSARLRAAFSRTLSSSFICRCRNSTSLSGWPSGRLTQSSHRSTTVKRASRAGTLAPIGGRLSVGSMALVFRGRQYRPEARLLQHLEHFVLGEVGLQAILDIDCRRLQAL